MILDIIQAINRFEIRCASKAASPAELRLQAKLNDLFRRATIEAMKKYNDPSTPRTGASAIQIISPIKQVVSEVDNLILNSVENVVSRRASIDLIKEGISRSSKASTDTIRDSAAKVLDQAYREGWSNQKTAKALQDSLENVSKWEAERIARTEIQSAQNYSNFVDLRDLGVEYHEWLTAGDNRVRSGKYNGADHVILNGQIVRIGDPFSNGLKYPGDRSGPIREWINCRCIAIPFLMPSGYGPPMGADYFYENDLIKIKI